MNGDEKVYIKRSNGSYVLLARKYIDMPWRFSKTGLRDGLPVYELESKPPIARSQLRIIK